MPGRTSARAAAWAASPARIDAARSRSRRGPSIAAAAGSAGRCRRSRAPARADGGPRPPRRHARQLDADPTARASRQPARAPIRQAGPGGTGPQCWPSYQAGATRSSTWACSRNGPSMSSATRVARPGSGGARPPTRPSGTRTATARSPRNRPGATGRPRPGGRTPPATLPEPLATRGASLGGQHRSDLPQRRCGAAGMPDLIANAAPAPIRPWPGPRLRAAWPW